MASSVRVRWELRVLIALFVVVALLLVGLPAGPQAVAAPPSGDGDALVTEGASGVWEAPAQVNTSPSGVHVAAGSCGCG